MTLLDNWTASGNGIELDSLSIPFSFAYACHEQQAFPHPYEDGAEDFYKLLERDEVVFRNHFDLDGSSPYLNNDSVLLSLAQVDTYAKVLLNGKEVGFTNNAHRTFHFNVANLLREGRNEVQLVMTSPLIQHQGEVNGAPFELPSGCEDGLLNVGCYSRKPQYQFGWDWGPRLVTPSLNGRIDLSIPAEASFGKVLCYTKQLDPSSGRVIQKMDWEVDGECEDCSVTWLLAGQKSVTKINGRKGSMEMDCSGVDLWWPNGHGEQPLYEMRVLLKKGDHILEQKLMFIGFKTTELIMELDEQGTSYFFKVNGELIFMKGANLIPTEIVPGMPGNGRYRQLLEKAKKANMNMIRVWGGGQYQSDDFYSTCDRLGLMVWQDFMFAGSIYPWNTEFIENVEAEVEEQASRLANHPCIAQFCGNNEVDVAIHNWGWQDKFQYTPEFDEQVKLAYNDLFKNRIAKICEEQCPHIPYTHTSPLSNWGTPENFKHLSMHYWGVWHGREPISSYNENVGRFMVEYGFQGFPSLDLLSRWTRDSISSVEDRFMQNRQKSYIGNGLIIAEMEKFGDGLSMREFCEKSQLIQADALEEAIRAHRRNKGHCMGTLLWQLNDVWSGPSWSILEHDLSERMAYQRVSECFEPFLVDTVQLQDSLEIYLINDLFEKREQLFRAADYEPWLSVDTMLSVESNQVNRVVFHKPVQN
ncbi:MAG: hypothetical protein AAF193_00420 [Bacteroidota bacterium]